MKLAVVTNRYMQILATMWSLGGFLAMAGFVALFASGSLLSLNPTVVLAQTAALVLALWARRSPGLRCFDLTAEPTEGGLVTTGPYCIIRHPIYTAGCISAFDTLIDLIPISEFPEGASAPLKWSLELWGNHIPGFSRSDWIGFYEKAKGADYSHWDPAGTDQELIYLAVINHEVVGAIALVDFDDLEEFRHLKPWVAAFVVKPELRRSGIGTEMLAVLEGKAKTLGINRLYLWTEDQTAFYKRRGYKFETSSRLGPLSFDLLSKELD
jgi:GNAT superfamily N-acetyltransferase